MLKLGVHFFLRFIQNLNAVSRKCSGGLMFRPDLDVTSAYVGFTGCGVSSGGGEGLVGFSLGASEDGS